MTTDIQEHRDEPRTKVRDVWHTDRVDAFSWAAVFVWGALVLIATNTSFHENYDWWEDGWGVFFIGAGSIWIIEAVVRLFMPDYSWKWWWSMMWGTVFLSFGLSALFGTAWLALALVAFAIATLRGALRRAA